MSLPVSLDNIRAAAAAIAGPVLRTPIGLWRIISEAETVSGITVPP